MLHFIYLACLINPKIIMNKVFYTILCLTLSLSLLAQETEVKTKDKKDLSNLPQAGDWAIGIDASPFFRYAGNFFSQNGNSYVPAFTFTAQYPSSIFLKFKTSSTTTIRAILIIGASQAVNKIYTNDSTKPNTDAYSALNIGGIIGIEKNKSVVGRISAYYGAQIGIQKIPFENGSMYGKRVYTDQSNENLNYKEFGGNTAKFSATGFGGLEWYIVPRVALSGELGLQFYAYYQNERKRKYGSMSPTTIDSGGWGINLAPTASGNLSLFIYF